MSRFRHKASDIFHWKAENGYRMIMALESSLPITFGNMIARCMGYDDAAEKFKMLSLGPYANEPAQPVRWIAVHD